MSEKKSIQRENVTPAGGACENAGELGRDVGVPLLPAELARVYLAKHPTSAEPTSPWLESQVSSALHPAPREGTATSLAHPLRACVSFISRHLQVW